MSASVNSDDLRHQRIAALEAFHDGGVKFEALKLAPFATFRVTGGLDVRSERPHTCACVIYN